MVAELSMLKCVDDYFSSEEVTLYGRSDDGDFGGNYNMYPYTCPGGLMYGTGMAGRR